MRCAALSPPSLADIILKAAHGCVATLVARRVIHRQDADDFVQELAVCALQRLERFDGRRATLPTFVNRVVRNAATDLLRKQRAAKRGHLHGERSLDATLRGTEGRPIRLSQLVDETQAHRARGRYRRSRQSDAELRLDLSEAIADLSAAQRQLCRLLTRKSVHDAASELGESPSTTYRRLAQVKEQFEQWGLREYT